MPCPWIRSGRGRCRSGRTTGSMKTSSGATPGRRTSSTGRDRGGTEAGDDGLNVAAGPDRREFLRRAAGAATVAALPGAWACRAEEGVVGPGTGPDLLFIMADDLGYADLSIY